MNKKWMIYGVAVAMCLVAGCQKSDTTSQAPPASNAPAGQAPAMEQPGTQQTQAPAQVPAQEQAQQAANQVPPEPPKPFVVPAGTSLPVILSTSISSYSAKPGDEFEGSLAAPVLVEGEEAIPKGARVTGTVVDAKKQGKFKGEALLTIKLTKITVRGKAYLIATHSFSDTEKGKGKRTAAVTGGSTAGGALIGGLAGGGKGAAIGAAVGAVGGLAVSGGTGGENVNLPAETKVNFKLSQAVTIER